MDRDDIIEDLNSSYNKESLYGLTLYLGLNPPHSLTKIELSKLIYENLQSKKSFNTLYSSISREAKIVLNHLVWFGISTLRHIEAINHIKISLDDFYGNTDDPFINLFKSYSIRELQLSTGLRKLFKKHITFPKSGEILYGLHKRNLKIIPGNREVIDNLDAIEQFITQEGIKSRGINKRILLKSCKKFSDEFNFKEPFLALEGLDKESYNTGSDILLRFLSLMESGASNIETIKKMLRRYSSGTLIEENVDLHLFYPFIKGLNKNYNINIFLKRARHTIISKIKSFHCDQWIDIRSLISNISLTEDTEIFDTSYFGTHLSIKVDREFFREFSTDICLILKEDSENYLITPLVKGIILLFHTLGAVDIAVAEGETENRIKFNRRGLTPFDNIFYFRLTELGQILLGLKKVYNEKRDESTIIFHNTKTMVTLKGKSVKERNFFKRIGKNIGDGTYLISFNSFFKECNKEEDLEYNFKNLLNLLGKDIPKVWNDFLTEIDSRINPTYNEQELLVINFPRENQVFIDTVLNNPKIRELFYMVEGFRGAFSHKNYSIFKKLMRDEGFLI